MAKNAVKDAMARRPTPGTSDFYAMANIPIGDQSDKLFRDRANVKNKGTGKDIPEALLPAAASTSPAEKSETGKNRRGEKATRKNGPTWQMAAQAVAQEVAASSKPKALYGAAAFAAAAAAAAAAGIDDEDSDYGDKNDDDALTMSSDELPASPKSSRVKGMGPAEITKGLRVNENAEFTIVARNENGSRLHKGGDVFFVAIRGGSRVRARIHDNHDGSYKVTWRPPISGEYSIAVSLFGVSLPGSPFTMIVFGAEPYAPNCEVSGDALFNIAARGTHTFEVRYRDRTGGVAQPEALDVFVVPDANYLPDPDSTTSQHRPPSAWQNATSLTGPAATVVSRSATPDPGGKGKLPPDDGDSPQAIRPPSMNMKPTGITPAHEDGEGSGNTKNRAIRVKIGKQPLIVRAEAALESEQIGLLAPGQMVTVIEERVDEATDSVRACVTYEQIHDKSLFEDYMDAVEGVAAGIDGGTLAGLKESKVSFSPETCQTGARAALHLTGRSNLRLSKVGGGYAALANEERERRRKVEEVLWRDLEVLTTASDDGGSVAGGSVAASSVAGSSIMIANDGSKLHVGWATLKKNSRKLVSGNWRLEPMQRQDYVAQWNRRQVRAAISEG